MGYAMRLKESSFRVLSGLMKTGALLRQGDFKTIHKRLKTVMFPQAETISISENIRPNPRALGSQERKVNDTAMSSKKVLIIDRNFDRLGSHISLSEIIMPLIGPLKDNNIRLELAYLENHGHLANAYKEKLVLHELNHFPKSMSLPRRYEDEVQKLATELGAFKPDVIYANSVDMFPVIDAARIASIPTIWNIREAQNWRQRFSDRHADIVARALACFSYPEQVIFVSQTSAENWQEFTRIDKTSVIRTAISPKYFQKNTSKVKELRLRLGVPKDDIILLTVGTLCEDKGQLDAAHAISHLSAEMRDKIHWVFIGHNKPSYLRQLKQAWPQDHAQKHLHFDGHIEDCVPYYYAANALVSCSRTEALPRNILEGKLAGLPIISSEIPGSREAAGLYQAALFYDLGDIETLASHIQNASVKSAMIANTNIDEALADYKFMLDKYRHQIESICGHSL